MSIFKKLLIYLVVIAVVAAGIGLFVYSANKEDVQPEQVLNQPIIGS